MTSMTMSSLRAVATTEVDPNYNSDMPRKKRKYIPGGPGGGGHWIEVEAPESSKPTLRRGGPGPRSATVELSDKKTPRLGGRSWRERTRDAAPASAARSRRAPTRERPTFDSAADAVAQVDGYKPREERSWDEFHPDLDLDAKIAVFGADDIDGTLPNGGAASSEEPVEKPISVKQEQQQQVTPAASSTPKRRPGRPPGRRPPAESMLSGLGSNSPPVQRPTPILVYNPRERLSLPKPSYRAIPSLDAFEQDKLVRQTNFVSKTMEHVGYQKNDRFMRASQREMIRLEEHARDEEPEPLFIEADDADMKPTGIRGLTRVEYDMDEQDYQWLELYNAHRREQDKVDSIIPAVFEVAMTQIEKEWHTLERRIPKPNPKPPQTHRPRSSSSAAVNGEPPIQGEEQDSKCAVCDDGDCENTNAIVFCDGCDLAVHQECYGVPYIPEGQWLCRKCQQVGKGTPTCIFCPNTDGAFKMTTEAKWAHLVCSIWIPEVTIGNASFMEPIMQVAEIPKSRWKLHCYICNQKMGACIQCGSRQCYQAFHVTCARKAKLFLKMKSTHGGPASLDASVLKAYCDKHVSSEWRQEHDVETATAEAKAHYRREMKGRRWADSQESALALVSSQQLQPIESIEQMKTDDDAQHAAATPGQRKKRLELQKRIWRLPSGAPIVPQVVLNVVETALSKFNPFPKRKEFVAEACKYWSLKREARRGAALLKRLQLQMETFSTAEISRRDFAAMGPSGGPKLQRRIEFSQKLEWEMERVLELCQLLQKREENKLRDAELLKSVVDTLYFPFTPLLARILAKAKKYDEKSKMFSPGLDAMQTRLDHRAYTTVSTFSRDLSSVFESVGGMEDRKASNISENALIALSTEHRDLTADQKEAGKIAKRIYKYIQNDLLYALRSESELEQKPFQKELNEFLRLEALLEANDEDRDPTSSDAVMAFDGEAAHTSPAKQDEHVVNGFAAGTEQGTEQGPFDEPMEVADVSPPNDAFQDACRMNGIDSEHDLASSFVDRSVPTFRVDLAPPEAKEGDLLAPLTFGGIPWYFERFDPVGLTINDERWAGADRAMSADLSDMDEDELHGLGVSVDDSPNPGISSGLLPSTKKAIAKKKKRARNFR